jgi:hypothetical protein
MVAGGGKGEKQKRTNAKKRVKKGEGMVVEKREAR